MTKVALLVIAMFAAGCQSESRAPSGPISQKPSVQEEQPLRESSSKVVLLAAKCPPTPSENSASRMYSFLIRPIGTGGEISYFYSGSGNRLRLKAVSDNRLLKEIILPASEATIKGTYTLNEKEPFVLELGLISRWQEWGFEYSSTISSEEEASLRRDGYGSFMIAKVGGDSLSPAVSVAYANDLTVEWAIPGQHLPYFPFVRFDVIDHLNDVTVKEMTLTRPDDGSDRGSFSTTNPEWIRVKLYTQSTQYVNYVVSTTSD